MRVYLVMKIFTTILLVYLFFFSLFHCSVLAFETDRQIKDVVVTGDLVVNNDNTYRTIIYKNEEEGISELRNLVHSSRLEECWIYVPAGKKWVEVGIRAIPEIQVEERFVTKLGLDIQLVEKLMAKHSFLIMYHIHPAYSLFLELEMKKKRGNGEPMTKKEIQQARTLILMKRAYPSVQDLGNMIENTMEFLRKNPEGNITFKICSHYGITEYSLTGEGRRYFACNSYSVFIEKVVMQCMKAHDNAFLAVEKYEQKIRRKGNVLRRTRMHSKQKRRNSLRAHNSSCLEVEPIAWINNAVKAMCNKYLRVVFASYQTRDVTDPG